MPTSVGCTLDFDITYIYIYIYLYLSSCDSKSLILFVGGCFKLLHDCWIICWFHETIMGSPEKDLIPKRYPRLCWFQGFILLLDALEGGRPPSM